MNHKENNLGGISLRTVYFRIIAAAVMMAALMVYSTFHLTTSFRRMSEATDAHIVLEQAVNLIQGSTEEGIQQGEPLGTTTARFQPDNEIKGLPEGKLQDTAVIDLILKVQLLNSGADVTSCALFKDTSDLPEGPVYYKNIFDIYKFDNTLYTLDVTGRELKNYMEWAAECYNQ